MRIQYILIAIISFGLLSLWCDDPTPKNNDNLPPEQQTQVHGFVGQVYDAKTGQTIADATVQIGLDKSSVKISGPKGEFNFVGTTEVEYQRVIVQKDGYLSKEVRIPNGVTQAVRIELTPALEVKQTVDSSVENTISVSDGASVTIPADNYVLENDGIPYTGDVTVHLMSIDVRDRDVLLSMPGTGMFGMRENGDVSMFISEGAIRVELTGEDNQELQLGSEKATIIVPAADGNNAPDTIPLWYYNDKAKNGEDLMWVEEGFATLSQDENSDTGYAYVGEVGHFTTWNCDYAYQSACTTGTVVDFEGTEIKHDVSKGVGLSYNGVDTERYIDSYGSFVAVGAVGGSLDLDIPYQSKSAGDLALGTQSIVPEFNMIKVPNALEVEASDMTGEGVFNTGWDYVTHNVTITYSTTRVPGLKLDDASLAKCHNVGTVVAD